MSASLAGPVTALCTRPRVSVRMRTSTTSEDARCFYCWTLQDFAELIHARLPQSFHTPS